MKMNEIDSLLIRAKLRPGKKGFHDLSEALELMLADKKFSGYGVTGFYKKVAKRRNEDFTSVQKGIARVVNEAIREICESNNLDPHFMWVTKREKVTTNEFVSALFLMLKN